MKKGSLQLQIPQPCHEDWNSFNPTKQGRFCGACQKEVIDFTQLSDQEIKNYFLNAPSKVCGRFHQKQLTIYPVDSKGYFTWRASFVALLLVLVSKFTASQPSSQNSFPRQEQSDKKQPALPDTIVRQMILQGVVLDEEKNPIPGANVILKGSTIGTIADSNGKYELLITNPKPSETIVASFIGMVNVEQTLKAAASYHLDIAMRYDISSLQGEVVVGGIVSSRKISPRKWWWKFRSWFR